MSEWQPIETVPKQNERWIVGLTKSGRPIIGVFCEGVFGRNDVIIDNHNGKWAPCTHWCELPEPPK